MKEREDNIQHLLGGYASGTLTPQEQQRLFEAAMDDQELFDALAREQALKEILDDPESRGYLRTALAEAGQKPSKLAWWWPAAGISSVAVALAVVLMVSVQQKQDKAIAPPQTAKSEAPTAPPQEMAKNTVPEPAVIAEAKPQKKVEQPAAAKAKEAQVAAAPIVAQDAVAAEEKEAAKPAMVASVPPPPPPQPSSQSASILFLQPRAFAVSAPAAPAAAPGAAAGGAVMTSRARAAAVPQESRKASAEAADKAERLSLAAGPVANAGIRYRIFRRNSEGEFVETRLDTRFEDGDEIQLLVEANALGTISIQMRNAQGWRTLPQRTVAGTNLRSAPIRLERGTLELGVMLQSPAPAAVGAVNTANGPRPAANQLTEVRGNAMYVVAPGLTEGVVATTVRITVH